MKRFAVFLLLLLLTGAAAGGWYLSTSLPTTDGTLTAPGLEARVSVVRDGHGIPTITAETRHDAYFALGFVHAQDRLWQMEMQRRAGAGRLSELLGEATVETDTFLRTLGLYRLAEASLQHLRPEVVAALEAYAEGVNAWIAARPGALAPEFLLLGVAPEPWRPADSLVWGRLMGLQLAGNWREELLRHRVLAHLPADKAAMLWAPYPAGAPTTVAISDSGVDSLLAVIPDLLLPRRASNVWAVAGDGTASGKPVLANDPHLGFSAPILWYLARVEAPGLSITGATVPGVPFHLIGHNRRIAWGITTTHSDLMDLFVEREAEGGYLTPEGTLPFETRAEVIRVRGGEPVHLTVRATRHGPIVSDLLGERAEGMLLALASATLQPDDRTAEALYDLNQAGSWRDVERALRNFHSPQQNVAYADTDGNIGFIVPGRVPLRRSGDGLLPVPGWTGAFDWTGWVPYDDLPRLYNPEEGRIVNANNRVVPDGYPYLLSAYWPEPYRAERILSVLQDDPAHDMAKAQALQIDAADPLAARFRPLLQAVVPATDAARQARALLLAWDGVDSRERPEPLLFQAWLLHFQRLVVADELGDLARQFTLVRPLFLELVLKGQGDWCGAESCTALAGRALDEAVVVLAEKHGPDMAGWRWGDVHRAAFSHAVLGKLPLLRLLSDRDIATDGGDFTVNRGTFTGGVEGIFTHSHGAGLRAVYDLANLADSRFIIATGQSGNFLSGHYDDQMRPWRDGAMLRFGGPAAARLILEPR